MQTYSILSVFVIVQARWRHHSIKTQAKVFFRLQGFYSFIRFAKIHTGWTRTELLLQSLLTLKADRDATFLTGLLHKQRNKGSWKRNRWKKLMNWREKESRSSSALSRLWLEAHLKHSVTKVESKLTRAGRCKLRFGEDWWGFYSFSASAREISITRLYWLTVTPPKELSPCPQQFCPAVSSWQASSYIFHLYCRKVIVQNDIFLIGIVLQERETLQLPSPAASGCKWKAFHFWITKKYRETAAACSRLFPFQKEQKHV